MREWIYRFAFPLVAVALLPSLVGIKLLVDQGVRLRQADQHFCSLERVTEAVWNSAIKSYSSLPNKTLNQKALLAQLKQGVAEIRRDTSCAHL